MVYATIIVPIIDRVETLSVSVPCGLSQTRQDVELIIACDGASDQVIAAAGEFERRDQRVKTVQTARSPTSTARARGEALRIARSDRIMILQDDDLWFPNHVEVMGAALDRADFATTISLAATLSGRLVAWPSTYGSLASRNAFLRGAAKTLYEAHTAFRRSSYDRCEVGWDRQMSGPLSKRLLEAHVAAANSVRWSSLAIPTAISFNSPPRYLMSTAQRAEELVSWQTRMKQVGAEALLSGASYASMFLSLLRVDPPGAGMTLPEYLSRYGLSLPEDRKANREDALLMLPLTDLQRSDIDTVFSLCAGVDLRSDDRIARIVADLLEPFSRRTPDMAVSDLLAAHFGRAKAITILEIAIAHEQDDYRRALLGIALSLLHLTNMNIPEAVRQWSVARHRSPLAAATCFEQAASLALADNRPEDAIAVMAPAIRLGAGRAFNYAQLATAQSRIGKKSDARQTIHDGLSAFPQSSRLQLLAGKVGIRRQ